MDLLCTSIGQLIIKVILVGSANIPSVVMRCRKYSIFPNPNLHLEYLANSQLCFSTLAHILGETHVLIEFYCRLRCHKNININFFNQSLNNSFIYHRKVEGEFVKTKGMTRNWQCPSCIQKAIFHHLQVQLLVGDNWNKDLAQKISQIHAIHPITHQLLVLKTYPSPFLDLKQAFKYGSVVPIGTIGIFCSGTKAGVRKPHFLYWPKY